jgi:hypothetical protein
MKQLKKMIVATNAAGNNGLSAYAQVGIGTTTRTPLQLEVNSSSQRLFLPQRLTTTGPGYQSACWINDMLQIAGPMGSLITITALRG